MALNASARPAPTMLSALVQGKRLPDHKIADGRARLIGGDRRAARLSKQGALCSTSAATPPTCGAAADVPKNGVGNAPAPVTATPSMPTMSGFSAAVERRPAAAEELRRAVRWVEARFVRRARRKTRGRRRRRRADRPDRDDADRRAAGVTLRRDAARRGVVVVPLVPRRRQQRRSGGRALGLERKDVQVAAAAPRRATFWTTIRNRSAAPLLT